MRAKNEGRLWPWVTAAVVIALLLSVGAYMFFSGAATKTPVQAAPVFETATTFSGPRMSVTLYFPSKDGRWLSPEKRDIKEGADLRENVLDVVSELVRGPATGLTPAFPADTRVKGVFIDPKGTAYVNFSRELQSEYPGGAWTETLTIYSLVNTLTEDFPEIKQVQILIEGSAVDTLAGHIDTSRPFSPRPALNKE
jgi:spore germination protein GerM